jgi:hypothetical protein
LKQRAGCKKAQPVCLFRDDSGLGQGKSKAQVMLARKNRAARRLRALFDFREKSRLSNNVKV